MRLRAKARWAVVVAALAWPAASGAQPATPETPAAPAAPAATPPQPAPPAAGAARPDAPAAQPAEPALATPPSTPATAPPSATTPAATPDAPPAPPPSDAAPTPTKSDTDDGAKEYPRVEIHGRVMAGVERVRADPEVEAPNTVHESQHDYFHSSRQPFFLDQSRFKLGARLSKQTRLSLSADVERKPAIRSAYLEVRLARWLRIRAGRFKRPFSELDNESRGDLPFRDRGIFNAALMEGTGWGDRTLGVMVWGRTKRPRLKWQLAVTNSAPQVDVALPDQLRGFDLMGNVTYEPIKWLEVGLHGGYKKTQGVGEVQPEPGGPFVEAPRLDLFGAGAHVRVKRSGVVALIEANLAENLYPPVVRNEDGSNGYVTDVAVGTRSAPLAAGFVGYVSYDLPLTDPLVLQPMVLGEWADTDTEYSQDETARVVLGVNLLWERHVRVMPQVELVRPLGNEGERSLPSSNRVYLLLSGEI